MFILEKMRERVENLNPEIDTEWVDILEKEHSGFDEFEILGGLTFQLVYSYSEDRFIVKSKYLDNYNSLVPKGKVTENNKYYCKLFDDVIVSCNIPCYDVFEWRNDGDEQLKLFTSTIKIFEMNIKDDLLKQSGKECNRYNLINFCFSGIELQKVDGYVKQEILKTLEEELKDQIERFFILEENNFQTHWFVHYLISSYDLTFLPESDREGLSKFIIRTCLEVMVGREINSNSLLKLLDTNLLSLDSLYIILQNSTFKRLKINEDFLINKITCDLKGRFLAETISDEEIKMIMSVIFHKTSFFEKINIIGLIEREVLLFLKEKNLIDTSKSKSLKLLLWLSK